jgi:hypothetical protein
MNDGALRAVKKLYICLCAARDMKAEVLVRNALYYEWENRREGTA